MLPPLNSNNEADITFSGHLANKDRDIGVQSPNY